VTSAARSRTGITIVACGFFTLFFRRPRTEVTLFGEGWPASHLVVAIVAAAFAVAAWVLMIWSIRTLGKQWSFSARVIEGHQLVTRGPFSIVRNPIYASIGLLMISFGLAFASPLRLAMALAFYVTGTLMRIRAEEELMRATFGAQWEEYRRRVPALIPWTL
jgi:protein-S-isoprenylcysteine O-methyltransferase Ste14